MTNYEEAAATLPPLEDQGNPQENRIKGITTMSRPIPAIGPIKPARIPLMVSPSTHLRLPSSKPAVILQQEIQVVVQC